MVDGDVLPLLVDVVIVVVVVVDYDHRAISFTIHNVLVLHLSNISSLFNGFSRYHFTLPLFGLRCSKYE